MRWRVPVPLRSSVRMILLYMGFAAALILQAVTHDTVLFLAVMVCGMTAAALRTGR